MHHNNPLNKGQRKDGKPQDNQSKTQVKKSNEKTNKYTRKWCKLHKIPWNNTNKCHSKQSSVVEIKTLDLGFGSVFDLYKYKGN